MVTAGFAAHDSSRRTSCCVPVTIFGVFRSMAEAVSWLDLGMTMIEPTASENPAPLTRLHARGRAFDSLICRTTFSVLSAVSRVMFEPSPRNVSLLRLLSCPDHPRVRIRASDDSARGLSCHIRASRGFLLLGVERGPYPGVGSATPSKRQISRRFSGCPLPPRNCV